MTHEDYIQKAIKCSQKSSDDGKFPAGAILVTKSGKVYESDPSLAYYHGEMMVIDKAIEAGETDLQDAVVYSSMQPCLMCSGKMYWSGVRQVYFAIPKEKTNAEYGYEDRADTVQIVQNFFSPITMTCIPSKTAEALVVYEAWVKKIEQK